MREARPLKLAVVGAGVIGQRHAERVAEEASARLSAIADPSAVGCDVAGRLGARWFKSFEQLLSEDRPDGVIVATPNQVHLSNGLLAVAARVPVLVEKPIADDVAAGTRLVEAAERAGVPLLVGHHRRYNPMIQKAKEVVDSGRLGRIIAVHGHFWVTKPDDYFDVAWRREKGGGPVFLNLIHDIDLFRYLLGEIVSVQAHESNEVRGNAVEETAVVLLRFASGALGTVTVSDCVVAPWSWELTAGENAAFPRHSEACYQFGGSLGSLSVPQLDLWSYSAKRGWQEALSCERLSFAAADPLKVQIRHFCDVIRGQANPIVSGHEGLQALKVIEAIKQAARSGGTVEVGL
jgi:predicted dehydrogenase